MADRTTLEHDAPAVEQTDARGQVFELCELLSRAGGVDFCPRAAAADDRDVTRLGDGWVLEGGDDPAQRRAAAELLVRTIRAEREIGELCGELVERYEEASLIYRLSRTLATVHGQESLARHIVADARATFRCRSAELWLRDADGVRLAAAVPGDGDTPTTLNEQGPLSSLEEGRPWLRAARAGHEGLLAVPLPGVGDQPAGVIVLRGGGPNRSYRAGDVKLLAALAALASAFLRSDGLLESSAGESPTTVEPSATPTESPALEPRALVGPGLVGLDIAGRRAEAHEGGSDRVDWIRLSDGGLLIAIGEGTGPGARAAVRTATVRGALLAEARRTHSPAWIARRVAEAVGPDLVRAGAFVSLALVRVLPGGRDLEWCNAGHHPPLVLRGDGRVESVETGGPALGLLSGNDWLEGAGELEPDDLCLMYTDGVVDRQDPRGRRFGAERLVETVFANRERSSEQIVAAVFDELERHAAGRRSGDDVTLVVARAVPSELDDLGMGC